MQPTFPETAQLERFLDDILLVEGRREVVGEIGSPGQLEQYILGCILDGSFRRTKIDADSLTDLRTKIHQGVAAKNPIGFAIPFGGYKNYRLPSFPGPDWAEVFNLRYMVGYLRSIADAYSPGATLQYTYSSGVMDVVSNIPTECTQQYMDQFRSLIELFRKGIPENLRIQAVDISQLYPKRADLLSELEANYRHNVAHWTEKLSEQDRQHRVASARHNLMVHGAVDLGSMNDEEWEARCVDAAMWCEALDSLSLRRNFNKYSSNVQLVFVRGPSLSVHVGSCETSVHHFWSGAGVIEPRGMRFLPRILSNAKLEEFKAEGRILEVLVENVFTSVSASYGSVPILSAHEQ